MNELIPLLKDNYFLFGIVLFFSSILGIVWILRSLQKQSADSAETEFSGQYNLSQVAPDATAKDTLIPESSKNVEKATLEILVKQLNNIEKNLAEIARKLEHQDHGKKNGAVAQTLKSSPSPGENSQIDQLSAKVEKIYQVLVALSNSEDQ